MSLDDGHILVGIAVVNSVGTTLGKLIGNGGYVLVLIVIISLRLRLLLLPPRCQDADEVAIPHVAFVNLLFGTTSWAEQVGDNHFFKRGPKFTRRTRT
jgi:hypothetical protein